MKENLISKKHAKIAYRMEGVTRTHISIYTKNCYIIIDLNTTTENDLKLNITN